MNNNKLKTFKDGEKWGFKDSKNNIIIPAEYDFLGDFENGLAYARKGDKIGYIDSNNKEIIPIKYDKVGHFSPDGFLPVCLKGIWGIIDKDCKEIIPLQYDSILSFNGKVFSVKLGLKSGFLEIGGKVIFPSSHAEIKKFIQKYSI